MATAQSLFGDGQSLLDSGLPRMESVSEMRPDNDRGFFTEVERLSRAERFAQRSSAVEAFVREPPSALSRNNLDHSNSRYSQQDSQNDFGL